MTRTRAIGVLVTVLASAAASLAAAEGPRQYYSDWKKHPRADYHYRAYYYKPRPNYSGYKHHYVVHDPQRPQHLYYYNPYAKKYWGRCPATSQGEPLYSRLPPEHQAASLSQIPESAFPEMAQPPAIPESEDSVPLDLPPDDLPGPQAPL